MKRSQSFMNLDFKDYFEMQEPKKTLYIMRGVPGAGKSTKARKLTGPTGFTVGADDWPGYGDTPESYRQTWDKAIENGTVGPMLHKAHSWTLDQVEQAMKKGVTPIVYDNTNIKAKDMKPAALLARKYGYGIDFAEPESAEWQKIRSLMGNPDNEEELQNIASVLAKRNVHGVPQDVIMNMIKNFHTGPIKTESIKENSLMDIIGKVPQSPKWHSEGPVGVHTRMVRKQLDQAIQMMKDAASDPNSAFSELDMNITPEERNMLRIAAWMHDIGKAGATTVAGTPLTDYESWKKNKTVPPEDMTNIKAIGHERSKYFEPEMKKLGPTWKGMHDKASDVDKEDLWFIIRNHMNINERLGKRLANKIVDPKTGKFYPNRKVKLLLTLMLMDRMGRTGTDKGPFGIDAGKEALIRFQNTADHVFSKNQVQKRKQVEFNPESFVKMLASKGLNTSAIQKAFSNKFKRDITPDELSNWL
jgi:hypothetical protein